MQNPIRRREERGLGNIDGQPPDHPLPSDQYPSNEGADPRFRCIRSRMAAGGTRFRVRFYLTVHHRT